MRYSPASGRGVRLLPRPPTTRTPCGEEHDDHHCPLPSNTIQFLPGRVAPKRRARIEHGPCHGASRTGRANLRTCRSAAHTCPRGPACAHARARERAAGRVKARARRRGRFFPRVGTIVPALPRRRGRMTLSLDADRATGAVPARRAGEHAEGGGVDAGPVRGGDGDLRMFPESLGSSRSCSGARRRVPVRERAHERPRAAVAQRARAEAGRGVS